MTDSKDHGFTGGFHQAVLDEIQSNILASVPEEFRPNVLNTPFADMVAQLAKPGEDIIKTLSFIRFLNLLQVCAKLIDKGNELDAVKKVCIYNKAAPATPDLTFFTLPSSQKLGEAHEALTPEKMHLLHMAVGFAGEATEMLEQVVAHVLGAELDVANVVEEAGDGTFYAVGLLNGVNSTLDLALLSNKAKLLGKRYAKGYTDAAAQARADKPAGE